MSLYETEHRKQKSVRLTLYQQQKLTHICELFGISYQRLFADFVDFFYMDMLEVQSGRVSISHELKRCTLELMDDYLKLKQAKGIIPVPFVPTNRSSYGRGQSEE